MTTPSEFDSLKWLVNLAFLLVMICLPIGIIVFSYCPTEVSGETEYTEKALWVTFVPLGCYIGLVFMMGILVIPTDLLSSLQERLL